MNIQHAASFRRDLKRLTEAQKQRVSLAMQLFVVNPLDPRLQNHKLHGKQQGMRAFSAGYDLRVLYREEREHTVIFLLRVGKHGTVYQ